MEGNLVVQRGLRLKEGQEHFCEPLQDIEAVVLEVGFQLGSQRVSMQSGSIRDRHRPRCRPFSCRTTSRTPCTTKW